MIGKASFFLATLLVALALFPRNEVGGASLEKPMEKGKSPDPLMDRDALGPNHARDEYYDYDFLNQPRYGGGYPRGLRAMQRHERMMKRLKRYADMEERPPFPLSGED